MTENQIQFSQEINQIAHEIEIILESHNANPGHVLGHWVRYFAMH